MAYSPVFNTACWPDVQLRAGDTVMPWPKASNKPKADSIKVYLAAAWSRKDEIKKVAHALEAIGIEVTSRWLDETKGGPDFDAKFLRSRALIDVADVRACDILVRFSDQLGNNVVPANLATGSRMVEMGMALALGKAVVVVGGHQPVFDYLPQVVHVKDVPELIRYLYTDEVQ